MATIHLSNWKQATWRRFITFWSGREQAESFWATQSNCVHLTILPRESKNKMSSAVRSNLSIGSYFGYINRTIFSSFSVFWAIHRIIVVSYISCMICWGKCWWAGQCQPKTYLWIYEQVFIVIENVNDKVNLYLHDSYEQFTVWFLFECVVK